MSGKPSFRNSTYRARVVEATVDMPQVIRVSSSDRVMRSRNGRTVMADSTPMKMLDEPARASAPDSPRVRWNSAANAFTTSCRTPRW